MSEYVNANGEKEELNPGDYDFHVASRASNAQHNIRKQEKNVAVYGDAIEGRVAQAAGLDLEGEQAENAEAVANMSNDELSKSYDDSTNYLATNLENAKNHYQENKDQYVLNAKLEHAVEQQAEEKEDRVEEARDDVEDALEGADKEKIAV